MFDDLDWPLNASYGFSAIAVFLVYSNYGPILYTVSEINGDATFPAPCIYDPMRGFSLKFCNGDGARKKLENDARTRMSKKCDHILIRSDTIPALARRTCACD